VQIAQISGPIRYFSILHWANRACRRQNDQRNSERWLLP
jgi:hypothetical protein